MLSTFKPHAIEARWLSAIAKAPAVTFLPDGPTVKAAVADSDTGEVFDSLCLVSEFIETLSAFTHVRMSTGRELTITHVATFGVLSLTTVSRV